MISSILQKIVGSQNERTVKKLRALVDASNKLEEALSQLPTDKLAQKTQEFQDSITVSLSALSPEDDSYYPKLDEQLLAILPEAFAIVREASRRTLGMRPFDVQIIGGIVLHQGKIAEMKTGEGKTLVAALPLYLNGITGLGAHLITVNDYLARRDAVWIGPVYKLLGLEVGVINHEMSYLVQWEDTGRAEKAIERSQSVWEGDVAGNDLPPERNLEALAAFKTTLVECSRQEAYAANVTYGTNNEFGFDYLRDNMKFSIDEYVQREHNFAIVDEVDSILIDEARTPLIISGPSEESTDMYYTVDKHVRQLKLDVDFTLDEKTKQATLTEEGATKVEKILSISNIYDPTSLETLHHVHQALRAHHLFLNDVDYIVKDGEVVIVDEFTGRLMPGRRWSDGLHQAIEAKERVNIENENQTLATITIQNYFRMYRKLSGMTGTADTEAVEFKKIYELEVVVIPTHKLMIREDNNDVIYKTEQEKYNAVANQIKKFSESGAPVLVGTTSIENTEKINKLLTKFRVPHNVLNAKQHEKEAEIVAQAGSTSAVTIATNMAGRGTDIVLGGNPEFLARDILQKKYKVEMADATPEQFEQAMLEAKDFCDGERERVLERGGLHIIGTERHESRRIDNQLRGRAGRQGDPGESRFYVSLEDDLMRIFASERIAGVMDKMGWEEGEPIEHRLITRSIENAQKKVEGRNFDVRKHLLEYDDVLNAQRKVVYDKRKDFIKGNGALKEQLFEMSDELVDEMVYSAVAEKDGDSGNVGEELAESIHRVLNLDIAPEDMHLEKEAVESTAEAVKEKTRVFYEEKENEIGAETMRDVERYLMLQTLDYLWKDHLLSMDHLREGIGLMGYAQKDPLYEYKKQGYDMFTDMMARLSDEVCEKLFRVRPISDVDMERIERKRRLEQQQMKQSRGEEEPEKNKPVRRAQKIGRNEPCPCGSGKKYKKCHGKAA